MDDPSVTDTGSVPDPLGQLADEFLERYRRGEQPALSDYTRRHPELAAQIRKLFRALVVMEDVRPGPEPAAEAPGQIGGPSRRLGEYRIVREIGRGGMGVVYEAEQESLGRRVALKVLPPGSLEDIRQVQRFRREARAAARLHHTNIVPVFGVGEDNGTYYYVMQYIEGRPLDQVMAELRRIRSRADQRVVADTNDWGSRLGAPPAAEPFSPDNPPSAGDVALSLWNGRFRGGATRRTLRGDGPNRTSPPKDRAEPYPPPASGLTPPASGPAGSLSGPHRLYAKNVAHVGVQVAEALEHAVGQGVLHRDVKPSNLLLDVWGTVWLTDFGLAKATGTVDLTAKDDVLGTLRYMAPERFEGRADVRSDVYALGLTLYELLVLRPAFGEPGQAQLARQITSAEPPRLDQLDPDLPRDLVTIVHKAMAKYAADRYQTPGAMAEDLRRFLDDRPIGARRAGLAEQAWRWCRRNPTGAALVVTALALITLAAGGGFWEQQRWAERRLETAHERREVESALEQADRLRQRGDFSSARAVLERLSGAGLDDLRQRLARARAELDLSGRLEAIRLQRANPVAGEFDPRLVAGDYAKAFRDAGWAVGGDDEQVAALLRESAIKEQLVAALDDWSFVAFVRKDDGLLERLLRLARRADPDPAWRDRFRVPAVWRDRRALERLAQEAPVAELSPPLLVVLASLLDLQGAEAESLLRAAQRLRPGHFLLNWQLGNVLLARKKPGEAVGFYRAALAVRPESSAVYHSLGLALKGQGRWDQAIDVYRKAIELDPRSAALRVNLGMALHVNGRLEDAVTEYRKAVELDPSGAPAHEALGGALLQQGRFAEARAATRRWLDLLSPDDPLRPLARERLGLLERLPGLDARLAAVLDGKVHPVGATEQRDLAALCRDYKRRYAAAARLYAGAFAAEPKLADDLSTRDRYNAARAAALAGGGQGNDAGELDGRERARLRRQALDWLRADHAAWAKRSDGGQAEDRALAARMLRLWQQDADLAGIRDEALDDLAEDERREWRKLWADVEALIAATASAPSERGRTQPSPADRHHIFGSTSNPVSKKTGSPRNRVRNGSGPSVTTTLSP
jgi:serine/threonine protein kinase/Flp pilus assembly protein TadD